MADLIRTLKFLQDFTTEESALYASVVQGASPTKKNQTNKPKMKTPFQSVKIHKTVNVSPKHLMGLHLPYLFWSK